jgi:drug/metabolite transporter (DMT)-like permease
MDRIGAAITLSICVVWGFNQVIAKAALAEVGPIAQSGVRAAIGCVCLIVYAALTKRRIFRIDGSEAAGALAGLLFALEFMALFESLRWTTAARSILFLYAAPFFVALGAALLLTDERPRPIQWLGLAVAFVGVAGGLANPAPGGGMIGDGLALIAAALWGATTVLIKATRLRRTDPIKTLLYQIGAGALAAPFAVYLFGEPIPTHISIGTYAALIWQGAVVVGVTYALWFWLLGRYPAAQLSAFTFVTPLVGVFAGWLVFGEAATKGFAVAIVLVVTGLALVNWPRRRAVCRGGRRGPA